MQIQMMYFYNNTILLHYPSRQGGLKSAFTGFNWNPRCPQTGNVIEEVRNPTGSLMELLYRMNEKFMGADVVHATPVVCQSEYHTGSFDIKQYTNFRSTGSPEDTPGYYKSTMKTVSDYLRILTNIKNQSEMTPTAASGNIYIGVSTTQLMLWGVVYDFMSFCTTPYGTNFEDDGQSVSYSRIKLTTEIAQYDDDDLKFVDIKRVFLSIAACANGLLTNRYVPSMIYNRNGDNSEENHEIDDNSSTDTSIDDNKSKNKSNNSSDPPNQKRTCNRMPVYGQNK